MFWTAEQHRRTSRLMHCASSGGRPNSTQGRNLDTCCTCCVTKDQWETSACSRTQITCASGQAITYTTRPLHHQARLLWCRERVDWRVEWHTVVFSERVGSVCMRVMDVHVYGVDLARGIFRSTLTYDTNMGGSPGELSEELVT